MKLNIGCYDRIEEGYIHLDKKKYFPEIDIVHDLNKLPYPFKDNTFDEILARNVLEHLKSDLIVEILKELHRIIKHKGILKIRVPFGSNCWRDITHTRGFDFLTFLKLNNKTRYKTNCKWEIIKMYGITSKTSSIGRFIPNFKIKGFIGFRDYLSMYMPYLTSDIYVELMVINEEG